MSTPANTPFELFIDQLRDIYSMETQVGDSMPHLVSLCTNKELRDLLSSQCLLNANHVAEITSLFERHGESPGHDTCKAMAGLIDGGTSHLEAVQSPSTRDLMMIAHCLRIEYYKMAAYEFTARLSGRLGLTRDPVALRELLAEEKNRAAALVVLEADLFAAAIPTKSPPPLT